MLKIAVIGTGFIGSVHARNIALHPGAELVAVNDANFEFAKKAADANAAQAVADIMASGALCQIDSSRRAETGRTAKIDN